MTDKSREETINSDFRSSIPELGDEQLLGILKKRSQYQKEAAELAIAEAIKRGLIHSELDLISEEFEEKKEKISFFPVIHREQIKNRTRKSIARVLLLIGAVPAVWGLLETFKGEFTEGILLLLLGAVWIYCALKLMRKLEIRFVNLLFILVGASVIYIVKLLLGMRGLVVMDYLIPLALYIFLFYGLFFLRRLK